MKDLEQAVDRIVHLIRHEEDRKVVFLTGSGISLPVVPSASELVDLFLAEMGPSGAQVRARIASYSASDRYQEAAEELKQRRGERSLSAAVRKAVLRAIDPSRAAELSDPESITHSDWILSPAQERLGKLAAKIPRQQLGAIVTTNFDPLTEAALERNNVRTATLATPGNQALPMDSVYGSLPVVHLHGYWASTATLSTSMHLNTERPQIERMITRLLDNAALIVIGYGGWEDSFTRTLVRMLGDGYMSSLESEIIWLQYSGPDSVAGHPILAKIQGEPGVNLYFNVDAVSLLDGVLDQLETLDRKHKTAFPGWDIPPLSFGTPTHQDLVSYFHGAHPNWSVSAMMPRLSNSRSSFTKLLKLAAGNCDGLLLLSAPAGEGKTTVLQQCAIDFASQDAAATVLFRRPGAPTITTEWISHIRTASTLTIVCADDADLTLDEIYAALRDEKGTPAGRIIWVLAAHSTYAGSSSAKRLLALVQSEVVEFGTMQSDDARQLSELWTSQDSMPPAVAGRPPESIASSLMEDSNGLNQEVSLFGAILSLWRGDGLMDRVSELLNKLRKLKVAGVDFRQLLAAVAITQHAWRDTSGAPEGLSLAVFGRLANVEHADVTRIVVRPLGREVGLSQIGDKVFVRHPAIAEAIFELVRNSGELGAMSREISRQGAILRFNPEHGSVESRAAYRLARKLQGDSAIEAAKGALDGASSYLEPRVTLLAALRENGHHEQAGEYATNLEIHLREYADYSRAARGFYVEWSVVEAAQSHLDVALRLAIRSVSDDINALLNGKQLEYGLTCVRNYAEKLSMARRAGAFELREAATSALRLLPDYLHAKAVPDHVPKQAPDAVINNFRLAADSFMGSQPIRFQRMAHVLDPRINR